MLHHKSTLLLSMIAFVSPNELRLFPRCDVKRWTKLECIIDDKSIIISALPYEASYPGYMIICKKIIYALLPNAAEFQRERETVSAELSDEC